MVRLELLRYVMLELLGYAMNKQLFPGYVYNYMRVKPENAYII